MLYGAAFAIVNKTGLLFSRSLYSSGGDTNKKSWKMCGKGYDPEGYPRLAGAGTGSGMTS